MTKDSAIRLSGDQSKQLEKALLSAFPRLSDLEKLLRYGLDQNLFEIAGNGSLSEISFRLIAWAESQGRTENLIRSAVAENPRNPELQKFAEQLGLATALEPLAPIGAPAPGKRGILIDLSHGQEEWELPFFRVESNYLFQLLQPSSENPRWDLRKVHNSLQINAATLKEWPGLILGIPHHVRIEETTRYELVKWVRQGGHLVLLGFELGERHHETNLNELASEFGLRFNSDIVAPMGWKSQGKPYGATVDFTGIQSPHLLLNGVNSLRLWNLCTLTIEPGADILLSLGDNSIGWLQKEGVNYTSKGWLRGGNQQFGMIKNAKWVPVIAEAPKGLTGQGSVLAIGTWELFERRGGFPTGFDNQRFIENLLDWCGSH
jgi:hypothetical protein